MARALVTGANRGIGLELCRQLVDKGYEVIAGQTLSLSGAGIDPGGDALSFAWDLDGDGLFGETGAAAERGEENTREPIFDASDSSGNSDKSLPPSKRWKGAST